MGEKFFINPVTRISGFLEIEVEIDNNKIIDAKSSGMLFRGFERMLKGRAPLDAIYFTQRICGICSAAHSMAASFALEDALNIKPTVNDRLIRNFIHGCEFIQNHLRQLYQFVIPDYVNITSINSSGEPVHDDYRLPENLNNKIVADYVLSFNYSRLAHEMLAELGGKAPHNHEIFVGGTTTDINISSYMKVKSILSMIKDFVSIKLLEDINIISEYYPEYFFNGVGYKNLMSYGCFNDYPSSTAKNYLDAKVLLNDKIENFDSELITENIKYSWYTNEKSNCSPLMDCTEPDRMKEDAYSWIKAPRYKGNLMEVGPLARMWLSGNYSNGISTMDRLIARALELRKIIEIMESLLEAIQLKKAEQMVYTIPSRAEGIGLIDTTRGSLGHWLSISEEKIAHYEIITPSAWNLSPMDTNGCKGVVEQALIGTEINNTKNPVEIGRIVRSYDPCISCATHVTVNQTILTIRII